MAYVKKLRDELNVNEPHNDYTIEGNNIEDAGNDVNDENISVGVVGEIQDTAK